MTKIMIILFSFLIVFSAQAATNGPLNSALRDAEVNENKTYFEVLGDLYKEGTKPSLDKIINIAWAGRCFLKGYPSEPINGGCMFRKARMADVGPIGRGDATYEAACYWNKEQAPNYYDGMTVAQVLAAQPGTKFSKVSAKDQELEIQINTFDKSAIKVSGKYLVEEVFENNARFAVGLRCYYFIPGLN
ncbi:hypothetical protein ACJVC5_17755 [Peredibacter sp. HCB2-198]|uniref:hypothetical protein n=1 Tax=Peredibacter sp. HCB2-198 TaxID=3383025 RepID=UPI0038B61197